MEATDLIKERLGVAEMIRQYLTLLPAGKNWKALCPFHKEKTPSFIVSPDRQTWRCFGCNVGGDIFEFVMRYEHLEFFEALKLLAERAGVDIRRFGGEGQKQMAALFDINAAAREWFVAELARDEAPARAAREYLAARGLRRETIEAFGVGFAPSRSDGLARHLTKLGYRIQDIDQAGLVFRTERGTYWDRFRGRIMFPLMNHFGKTVAFTGRVMPGAEGEGVGKYVNSPETPLFSKSKLLYGFHASKQAIRDAESVLLLEGQMDFLMTWQDGVTNAVASSGTALTADHLKPLRRVAHTLIVGFDNDEAGFRAGERVIDLASGLDFTVRVLPSLPAGMKDPADAAQSSPGLMKKLAGEARPAMEFYFDRYLPRGAAGAGADIRLFKEHLRAVLGKIRMLASAVEQEHWLKELARRTGVGEHVLLRELAALGAPRTEAARAEAAVPPEAPARSRQERIAERLIILAFREPSFREALEASRPYVPPRYEPLCAAGAETGEHPPELRALVDELSLRASLEARDASALRGEFDELVRELRREHLRSEQFRLREEIRRAEEVRDSATLARALVDFDKLAREMNSI